MLLFLKKWSPLVMVVLTAIGMLLNINNADVFNAYITGFTGWIVVTMNELIPQKQTEL